MTRKCLVCGSNVSGVTNFNPVALLNKPIPSFKRGLVTEMEVCFCPKCDHISTYLGRDISRLDLQEKIYSELYSKMTQTTASSRQAEFADKVLNIIRQWIGGRRIRILEIGCHDGYIIGNLAKDGHTCFGVEPSSYAEFALSEYPNVNLYKGFFDEGTFPGEMFDLIIARHVVEHVSEPLEFVRKLTEKLVPDGLVYIEVPASLDSLKSCYYPEFHVDHVSYFTPRSFNALHQLAGLGNIKSFEVFESYLKFPFMGIFSSKSNYVVHPMPEFFYTDQMPVYIERFRANFERYRRRLIDIFSIGRVAIWGAGSVANRYVLDSGASIESYRVFDINEVNIGSYLSASGAEVLDARSIPEMNVDRVLIASSWEEDVRRQIKAISGTVEIVGYSDLLA